MKLGVLCLGLICSFPVLGSELTGYYKLFQLKDLETSEIAKGQNVAGFEGNFFDVFYFEYEYPQGDDSKRKNYENLKTDLEDFSEKATLGLKPLSFFDVGFFKDVYIEYTKDIYIVDYSSTSKYYRQEFLFLGKRSVDNNSGIDVSYGIFTHNNEKEIFGSQEFASWSEMRNVHGLVYQVKDIFVPYKEGRPLGFHRYGTGILVDDIRLQYQISGGDDYILSFGLGLAHRSKSFNLYAKSVFELTTNTLAKKLSAGVSYTF